MNAGASSRIRLRGINGPAKGQTWESATLLRAGRLDALELVLPDESVSRRHAEIRATDDGWKVIDLGSTNGTFLNGVRIEGGAWPIRKRDLVQFGDVAVLVEELSEQTTDSPGPGELRIERTAQASWDDALVGLAYDENRLPRPGDQLIALIRASQHLGKLESEQELLNRILEDAVSVLAAQRGAIMLAEGPDQTLQPKALRSGLGEPRAHISGSSSSGRPYYSQSLAMRCFTSGESVLCQSPDQDQQLAVARSIVEGSMASAICVLLRTPRRRLGVLHLDRGPWQPAFTHSDLHLADALAASVSAGIETAWLLKKQRDLFLDTITMLAQTVELRDQYTGGHTQRVTYYSTLLGEELAVTPNDLELIRIGGPLHDIGKIGVDDAILRKPDRLTPAEFELMKLHTVEGARIIQTVPDLHPVLPIVRNHHERWDGAGYPDQLAGDSIPRLARIVGVADAFDAMTSDRPYRAGMDPEVAFEEVRRQMGRQFDPECAVAFLGIREKILEYMATQNRRSATCTRMTASRLAAAVR